MSTDVILIDVEKRGEHGKVRGNIAFEINDYL